MQCGRCQKAVHVDFQTTVHVEPNTGDERRAIAVLQGVCPACRSPLVALRRGTYVWREDGNELETVDEECLLYPPLTGRLLGTDIPNGLREEFHEASAVLNASPRSSAALSRRLLQRILREVFSIRERDLAHEIDAFLGIVDMPGYLKETVDAVRAIGNYAAHPEVYTDTRLIVDVTKDEAQWLLEVIEALLEFRFTERARRENRVTLLNEKLAAMGKPRLKG